MQKVKIGMVGVGDISGIYLKNITGTFDNLEVGCLRRSSWWRCAT